MRHSTLVLKLLAHELSVGVRSMTRYQLISIGLGGAVLLAYGIADAVVALRGSADTLRQLPWLWGSGLPTVMLAVGVLAGLAIGRLARDRAFAPFLKALPLSIAKRRVMAAVAAATFGIPLAAMLGGTVFLACMLIEKPDPLKWAIGSAALFAAGLFAAATWRVLRSAGQDHPQRRDGGTRRSLRLGSIDRARPAWIGIWAWKIPAGDIRRSGQLIAAIIIFTLSVLLAAGASLAQRQAAPAALAALVIGFIVFMLTLRYHPLGSPVLRTAPIGFTRAWLRLMRLPLLLSAAVFVLPASAALAAEPAAWALPVAGGFWLLVLNLAYAAFAAHFMKTPFLAAFSFIAALGYSFYESVEYGRTILIGFVLLILWLWHRARLRFRHG
ncbi:hypothetical protein G3545_19770 [Starkeya sp. ORNL1]|uniref:hypothetical protein n=1 Tax=Starkeya sp. ORNL1 TaxID=2709380 RepID=UPI001464A614|nr:hypothetical protein [Starkeya sp. ORNL1]QJP15695.1 hypothetical protein G3545_19770 [Starkeya sp. ORNL1]